MKKRSFICSLALAGLALTTSPLALAQTNSLLIYCGITMVRPITELATNFERREHIKIRIAQGGSEDLYQSVRKSRLGDLYFPGEPSYRDKYLSEGLLGDYKVVGYNQLAILVQKGNPKKVKPELKELLRKDLVLMIGNAQSGSVGLETRQTLDRFDLYPQVVSKAAFLMPDSRSLALSMKRGEADVTLSWRATAFFPDNAPHMDTIDLDPKITPPQGLLLIQLTFSRNQEMARKFSDYVASPEGQATFRKFGFLDANQKS
jgi:molybdate transport system substrate-binding protein